MSINLSVAQPYRDRVSELLQKDREVPSAEIPTGRYLFQVFRGRLRLIGSDASSYIDIEMTPSQRKALIAALSIQGGQET